MIINSEGREIKYSLGNRGPGMASYRKSLLTWHSVMEMCFSCFMNTKYKCLRLELPICNKCPEFEAIAVVADTLFSELIAKKRPDEHCISAIH